MTDATLPAEFNDSRQARDAIYRPQTAREKLDELYHILRPAIEAAMERQRQRVWADSEEPAFWSEEIYKADKALLRAGEILGITESENK